MRTLILLLTASLAGVPSITRADHNGASGFADREAAILRAAVNVAAVMRGETPPYGATAYPGTRYYPGSYSGRYDDDDDYEFDDDDYEDRDKAYRKHLRREQKAHEKQRKTYEKALRKQRKAFRRQHRNDGRFLPPGLRKRAHDLPPGWERKLRAGRVLPHDVYRGGYPVSAALSSRLGYVPGTELLVFDDKVARVAADTRLVLDVIGLLSGR